MEKLKKENQSKLDNLKLQQQTSNNQISKETIKKYIQSVVDIDNKTNEQKRTIIVNLVKKITIISHNDDNGDKKPLFDVIIEGDLGKLCANNLSTQSYQSKTPILSGFLYGRSKMKFLCLCLFFKFFLKIGTGF